MAWLKQLLQNVPGYAQRNGCCVVESVTAIELEIACDE